MLELIRSPKQSRPSMRDLFRNAFTRKLDSLSGKTTITDDMSLVLLGVKAYSTNSNDDTMDYDYLRSKFELMNCIQYYMANLTPKQFMNTFPVRKVYDGERYECKDYFSTMEMVNSLDQDAPIGNKIDDFLWDYMNRDTQVFMVSMFSLSSKIMRMEGKPGILERLSADFGIPLYYGDKDGKSLTGPIRVEKHEGEYHFDDSEAKTLKRAMPKYLKLANPAHPPHR